MAWLSGWNRRQKLTIDHTKIDADLTNFPVKVILLSNNPIFTHAKSDGSDIRFAANDGTTLLSFEREVHDNTQQIAVYHVKLPFVSSTSDTEFYVYYGNSEAADASDPPAVWDNDYKLVMHMGPTLEDSTGNGNDGTNYGSTLVLSSNGYYRNFDGANDYILAGSNIPTYDNMTIEAYCKVETFTGSCAVLTRNFGEYEEQYGFRFDTNATLSGGIADTDKNFWVGNVSSFSANINYYVSMVFSEASNTYSVFRDTTTIASGTLLTESRGAIQGVLNIGRDNRGSYYFDGNIYEIRISSDARSDTWIKATNYTLHNQLLTIGTQEILVQHAIGVLNSLSEIKSKKANPSIFAAELFKKHINTLGGLILNQIKGLQTSAELSKSLLLQINTLESLRVNVSNGIDMTIKTTIQVLKNIAQMIEVILREKIDIPSIVKTIKKALNELSAGLQITKLNSTDISVSNELMQQIISNIIVVAESVKTTTKELSSLIEIVDLTVIEHYLNTLVEEKGVVAKDTPVIVETKQELAKQLSLLSDNTTKLTKQLASIEESVDRIQSKLNNSIELKSLHKAEINTSIETAQFILQNLSTLIEISETALILFRTLSEVANIYKTISELANKFRTLSDFIDEE